MIDSFSEKKVLIEKEVQQQIMNTQNDCKNGYFMYDIEYTQPQPFAFYEKSGRFDLLGIKFSNGIPQNIAFFELKSTIEACDGKSGVKKHYQDMNKYCSSKSPDYMKIRKEEARKLFEIYSKLELRGITQNDKKLENKDWEKFMEAEPEINFIFSNEAASRRDELKNNLKLKSDQMFNFKGGILKKLL